MTQCDFDAHTMLCRECGYKAARLPTFRRCAPPPVKKWKPILVGDLVEKALTAIGVTQPLVERLTKSSNKPGGCGCSRRKKWMNEQGIKAQVAIRNAAHSYAKTIGLS